MGRERGARQPGRLDLDTLRCDMARPHWTVGAEVGRLFTSSYLEPGRLLDSAQFLADSFHSLCRSKTSRALRREFAASRMHQKRLWAASLLPVLKQAQL